MGSAFSLGQSMAKAWSPPPGFPTHPSQPPAARFARSSYGQPWIALEHSRFPNLTTESFSWANFTWSSSGPYLWGSAVYSPHRSLPTTAASIAPQQHSSENRAPAGVLASAFGSKFREARRRALRNKLLSG